MVTLMRTTRLEELKTILHLSMVRVVSTQPRIWWMLSLMANGYPITDANSEYNDYDPYANRDPRLKAYILVNGYKIGSTDGVVNSAADF